MLIPLLTNKLLCPGDKFLTVGGLNEDITLSDDTKNRQYTLSYGILNSQN